MLFACCALNRSHGKKSYRNDSHLSWNSRSYTGRREFYEWWQQYSKCERNRDIFRIRRYFLFCRDQSYQNNKRQTFLIKKIIEDFYKDGTCKCKCHFFIFVGNIILLADSCSLAAYAAVLIFQSRFPLARSLHLVVAKTICKVELELTTFKISTYACRLPGKSAGSSKF